MPAKIPDIAIVILNWNGVGFLKRFLPVLIKFSQHEGVTIYVADNGSTDDSVALMTSEFPEIQIIKFEQNLGFAAGYNEALRVIKSDYYVILNSDVEVTEHWLTPIIDYMESYADVAACQPKILSEFKRDTFEHAGAAGGYIDSLGYPFCRGRIFSVTEKDIGQYDSLVDVFWATGACLIIRASVFHSCGGFDADFFAHMEEIDLCWRIRSRGYRIVCVPQSKVFHVGGGTLSMENSQKTYLNYRNNLLMLYKNLPSKALKRIMFIRFLLDNLAALQFLLAGKNENAYAIHKARRDFKKMVRRFDAVRAKNIIHATTESIPEIFKGSIVIRFYLQGKKRFSEL